MSSSSSRQSLRPLLPLAPQDPGSSSDQETLVPGLALPQTTVTPANRRRVVARAACIPCRRRKTKCSAERPTCNECLRRRSPDCCYNTTDEDETPGRALKRRYADLESQATAYEQVYDILRTRSESQVDEIVRRIRAGENPGSIIRHVEHGDLLIQLNVVPEARFRYEFPFRITFPSRLLTQANPYLDSQIYEWESRQDHGLSQPQQQSPRLLKDTANVPAESPRKDSPTAQKASTDTGVYLKPYHAAEVYDTLLDSTEPSKWTSVIKDNALLRNLLRTYFLHDYVWFTAFQKDYFLADMIAGRRQFCSSLLVNAVLAIACHGDRSITDRVEFWNPHTLGYRFLNEARRLWEVEVASERIRLTTIQAAILLNYVYNMNSMVQLGWGFTLQAMDWARKINLFKKPNNPDAMDPRFKLGRDFTAWCLFEWQSHCTYFLFQRPLQEDPPETPLPNVVHQPSWYGEVWLRYPLEQNLFPYNFGQFFKAKSELRVILNDISRECYGRSTPNYRPSLEKVGELYTRLYSWYANLPECLLPKNIVFSGQMKLHMHYHHAVITLLHPLVTLGTARAPSPGDEPTSASTRSLGQMPNGTSGGNPLSISAILNSDSDSHNAGGSSSSSPPAPTGDKPCSPGRPPPSPSRCLPSIEAAVTQARIHYETILRLYYLRHGFEGLDPFLTVALITNSFLTIEELDAFGPRQPETQEEKDYLDSLRSTLVLCAKGLFEQGKSYFLAQTLFKLVRDGMDDKDVELLREHIHQQKQDEEAATKNEEMRARLMKGLWPLVSIPEPSNRIIINGDYEQEEEKKEEDASGVWKKMDGMLRKYGGLKLDDEPGGDEDDDGVF